MEEPLAESAFTRKSRISVARRVVFAFNDAYLNAMHPADLGTRRGRIHNNFRFSGMWMHSDLNISYQPLNDVHKESGFCL